jgi:HlyD family secretion protein
MGVWIKRIVTLAVVGGVAWWGWGFFKGNGAEKKDEVTYETGKSERGSVRSFVTATGVIQPFKVVDVKSNVAGRIDRLYVDLGQPVKKGQLIAEIDPTDTVTALEQANSDLQSAQARRFQALASLRQQEASAYARIAGAEQSIAGAKARMAQAAANKDAQPDLTTYSIDQAKAAKSSAEKSLTQARETKRTLEEQLAQLREVTIPLNIRTANANASQARANAQTAESEYRRQRELLAQGYVAKSEVEDAYARLATARSNVETADQRKATMERENQISIREMQSRIAGAQSSIEEAQDRIDQAEASLRLANKNRYLTDVRDAEYDAAEATHKQALADLRAARSELETIKVRRAEITAANAQITRVNASVRQAKTNLSYTRIVAPRDGVVIAKNVEEGTVVPSSRASIGSTNALLQLGDISTLWVVCDVDETDIGQVSVGQKVTVKVDAFPSSLPEGKVIRIDPQAKVEQNVTLIPVTVQLEMADLRFRPGMNATCEFIVDEVEDVVTVPNEALKERGEGEFYVQQLENGKPKDIPVTPGLAGPDTTEIREGLKEGEDVITRIIEPEKPQTNNPFASPFGRPPGGGGRGGPGGSGGGGSGGGGGGAPRR